MNKKIILGGFIVLSLIIGGLFFLNKDEKNLNNDVEKDSSVNNSNNDGGSDKMNKSIVLYFSATGTTKKIAEYIKDATNSDIVEIIPKDKYTDADLNYNNDNSRANREQNSKNSRREIENNIDVSNYDVIYLGYPIWWGTIPKIILTLIENSDFKNKTIIPFCTSGGSGISESINDLKSYGLNALNGKQFGYGSTKQDVEKWLNSLK